MSVVTTEQIWSFRDGHLWTRGGEIVPTNLAPERKSDTTGLIDVQSGLFPTDVIVFMGYLGLTDKPEHSFYETYLVTTVQPDGSGIMVTDSLAAKNPGQVLTDRFRQQGREILAADYSFGDFGAGWLDRVLRAG